jgi:hypothetical protein
LVVAAWALLCTITPARRDLDMFRVNLALLHPKNPYGSLAQACHPEPGLDRAKCLILDAEEKQAILYVQSKTMPDDHIFVGVPRYDVLFDNDISFYFFSKRDAGTKWHDLHPGVETTAPIQREIISDLEKNHVRYVVEDDWPFPSEPNASRISSGVTQLSDYIRRNYALEREFSSIGVLRRTAPFR